MLINLKTAANLAIQHSALEITQRLPQQVQPPCKLACDYSVSQRDNYYLLNLAVDGVVVVNCQRCLHDFNYHYINSTEIAICNTEAQADELMSRYECIVSDAPTLDLSELITDELHLYLPQNHEDTTLCDPLITSFIGKKDPK